MKKLITIFLGLGLMAGGIWLIGMEESTEPMGLKHMPAEIITKIIDQEVAQAPRFKEKFAIIARYKRINKRLNKIAQDYENIILKNYIVQFIQDLNDAVIKDIFGYPKELVLTDPIKYAKLSLQQTVDQRNHINKIINAAQTLNQKQLNLLMSNNNLNPNTIFSKKFHQFSKGGPILIEYIPLLHIVLSHSIISREKEPTQTIQKEMVQLLLNKGADVNIKNNFTGETALMLAAQHGNNQAVQLLLDAGANPLLKNKLGKTAKNYTKNTEIINVLQKAEDEWREK